MKRISPVILAIVLLACTKQAPAPSGAKPTTAAAIVEVSGGKQSGGLGAPLSDPIVVQVNDAQGTAVQGALVAVRLPSGAVADPASGVTDSSGQFTTTVSAPGVSGHFQVVATSTDASGKPMEIKLDEIGDRKSVV